MPAVKRLEIRQRRQRLGEKLAQFSERAGVRYQTLANIESGCQVPSIEVVYRIANALGCDAEEILDEPGSARVA